MKVAPLVDDKRQATADDGPDDTLLRLVLYLWLAVVAAWMIAACEVLLTVPR
jgi:hypothetical protein